jgi:predicted amidohydrolase YtcJ
MTNVDPHAQSVALFRYGLIADLIQLKPGTGLYARIRGTDSTNVSALDPWLALFYMTTGRNLAGELTNDGQQISRVEALGLYTRHAAWFSFDERQLGSFETGKHADLAVLSDDYLGVREESLRKIESLLTLAGGRVVHAAAPFI